MERNTIFPRSLHYLIAVAEHCSFTRAAEALYISQPTLSQQIKRLEELLHVQLLERAGRTVRLTEAGKVYLTHAQRALGELEAGTRAIKDLHGLSRGLIRLGLTPITDHMSSSLLENFSALYPGISISALEMSQDSIENSIANDRIDIGIMFSDTFSPALESNGIESRVLFVDHLHLAVGKNHSYVNNKFPIMVSDLQHESLVLLNTDFEMRRQLVKYFHKQGCKPNISIEANSLGMIMEIIRLGRLSTILPASIISTQWEIYPVLVKPDLPNHAVTLVSRVEKHRSTACQAFYDFSLKWASGGRGINAKKTMFE